MGIEKFRLTAEEARSVSENARINMLFMQIYNAALSGKKSILLALTSSDVYLLRGYGFNVEKYKGNLGIYTVSWEKLEVAEESNHI